MNSSLARRRKLINGVKVRATEPRNFMAAAGFGSFAQVGRNGSAFPDAQAENLYMAVEVGEACQLRCRHCIYHQETPAMARPNRLVMERLQEAVSQGLRPLWISLSGKEPTLFPAHMLGLGRIARDAAATTVLMTNGLLLCGDLLEEAVNLFDYFDISLDGVEEAHDWMRGAGTFRRTWSNLENILARHENRIGIIATGVNADLPSGKPQVESIKELARWLMSEVGPTDRVSLTVSLYYGEPGDNLLLTSLQIVDLLRDLASIGFPGRILFTSNYAHMWPQVSRELKIGSEELAYDIPTGFPFVSYGSLKLILFNLTVSNQLALRISNEGHVFLSCNHLTLGDRAFKHSIADLSNHAIGATVDLLRAAEHPVIQELGSLPNDCVNCADFSLCRGGDALSGLLFDGVPGDPYCQLIEREG